MISTTLRHGIFLPPFHPMDENPTQCLERDLDLMVLLDRLGFHEAWIGEHHSAGWELISSPELFIAVAAERTRSIRFVTGMIPLSYRNPLMVANRIIQLDHHTRGRIMFGAGPGLLAGKYGLSMICVAATNPFGFDALDANWKIANDIAAEQGRAMDPSRLRLVRPMHIAETRAQASENVKSGLQRYLDYLNNNQPRFIVPPGEDAASWFAEQKFGVIGTPDDAIALIERLQAKQDRFGVMLQQAHNWADWSATQRCYELYARYVMPHFSGDNIPRAESFDWCTAHRDELTEKRSAAARAIFDKHAAEQRARQAAAPARPQTGREAW